LSAGGARRRPRRGLGARPRGLGLGVTVNLPAPRAPLL